MDRPPTNDYDKGPDPGRVNPDRQSHILAAARSRHVFHRSRWSRYPSAVADLETRMRDWVKSSADQRRVGHLSLRKLSEMGGSRTPT